MSDLSFKSANFDLENYLIEKKVSVEKELNRILYDLPQQKRITSAIRYSLTSGGKRLRPILCIASFEAVSVNDSLSKSVLATGCALEMVHTYSLIHDDLPAMDDDDVRRGKATCHKAFDEATAILAGDALLTMAFETLSGLPSQTHSELVAWHQIIKLISGASGLYGMVGGQMSDIQAEGRILPLEDLREMHRQKTGALIEASVCSGAILGGAGSSDFEKLKEYSENIGLAFQVADDILNIVGDPKLLGKSVGTDAERNKNTFPSLMGLAESKRFAEKLINKALRALSGFDAKAEPLRAIARYVVERKR